MRTLITADQVGLLARPCYADATILNSLIKESEREDVKSRIGDSLYLTLVNAESDEELTEDQRILLDGGEWTEVSGRKRYLVGLRTALAYYVYARVVRDGNIQSTRYGARIKTEENSNPAEDSERQRQYRQVFASADAYLVECLGFIKDRINNCSPAGVMRNNRTRIKVIGADSRPVERPSKPFVVMDVQYMTSEEIRALFNK